MDNRSVKRPSFAGSPIITATLAGGSDFNSFHSSESLVTTLWPPCISSAGRTAAIIINKKKTKYFLSSILHLMILFIPANHFSTNKRNQMSAGFSRHLGGVGLDRKSTR